MSVDASGHLSPIAWECLILVDCLRKPSSLGLRLLKNHLKAPGSVIFDHSFSIPVVVDND